MIWFSYFQKTKITIKQVSIEFQGDLPKVFISRTRRGRDRKLEVEARTK